MEEYTTGTGQKILVHDRADCSGYCPIHWPSDHHMRDWPTNWRSDWGAFMERICPHGIGHPDPDDKNADPVHGCDGCCVDKRG